MTANISLPSLAPHFEVVSVIDFAKKQRLAQEEQKRLVQLLGHFARKHELLINVRRETRVR